MLDERDYVEEKRTRRINTTNQNIDDWRRINKEEVIDIPEDLEEDPDFPNPEEEVTGQVIKEPEKKTIRTPEINIIETGYTSSKKANPISQLDTGVPANVANNKLVYYPKEENKDMKDRPEKNIYLNESVPEGTVNEYDNFTITVKLNFYKQDWDNIYRIIKSQRDTIKQFARRAMVQLAEEITEKDKLKKKWLDELTKEQVLADLKEKVGQELAVEKTIWKSRYTERDPDAVKLYPELNQEMKKQLDEEETEKQQLLRRLQRKDQKQAEKDAREARMRARALRKQAEDAGKEIEVADEMVQEDLENMQSGPPPLDDSALNKDFQFDTEGVMPEEIEGEAVSNEETDIEQ